MAQHTHTPGPWSVLISTWGHNRVEVYAGGNAVARVAARPRAEERRANARLLAAAPDLLAVCEQFLVLHPKERDDIALEDIIRAAVTKAKGGVP